LNLTKTARVLCHPRRGRTSPWRVRNCAWGGIRPATPQELAEERVRNSQEYEQLKVLREKQKFFVGYGRLLKEFNLSSADEEKFLGLLLDRERIPDDINQISRANDRVLRGPVSLQALRDVTKGTQQAIEAEIQEFLGPERTARFKDYEDNLPANLLVTQIQQASAILGASLSDAQVMSLTKIFSENPVSPEDEHGAIVPVAYSEMAPVSAGGLKFIMLPAKGWFVDTSGLLTVNFALSETARIHASRVLAGHQQIALNAIKDKQQAERMMAAAFNFRR